MPSFVPLDQNTTFTKRKRLVNFKCWNSEKNVSLMLATTVAKIQERSP